MIMDYTCFACCVDPVVRSKKDTNTNGGTRGKSCCVICCVKTLKVVHLVILGFRNGTFLSLTHYDTTIWPIVVSKFVRHLNLKPLSVRRLRQRLSMLIVHRRRWHLLNQRHHLHRTVYFHGPRTYGVRTFLHHHCRHRDPPWACYCLLQGSPN